MSKAPKRGHGYQPDTQDLDTGDPARRADPHAAARIATRVYLAGWPSVRAEESGMPVLAEILKRLEFWLEKGE